MVTINNVFNTNRENDDNDVLERIMIAALLVFANECVKDRYVIKSNVRNQIRGRQT